MSRTRLLSLGVCLFVGVTALFGGGLARGQSLDSKKPTPLMVGENHGTVDNMVGAQYWGFRYHKGDCKVTVRFTSMGLLGNAQTTTVNVVLYGANGDVFLQRTITSNGREAQIEMPGNFTGPGSVTVAIKPTGNALVRAGGDYTIVVTGTGVELGAGGAPATAGIVGTYSVMVCAPDFDCQSGLAIKFAADGTAETTDGHSGTWKLFDPDQMIYTLVMGGDRWTLKLVPGRGLFATSDLSVVVFQAIRPR